MNTISGYSVLATAANSNGHTIYLIAERITNRMCTYWWINVAAKKVFHKGDGTMQTAFARARSGQYKIQKRKRIMDPLTAVKRMAILFIGVDFYSLPPRDREIAELLLELKLLTREDRGILIAPIVAGRGK